jgi:hypothetical protein
LQWLIYPSQTEADNIKNIMHETSGHFTKEAGNI